MKKFVFNMQKILDLRNFEKKQAELELGKAVSEETRIQDTLELIAQQRVTTVHSASEFTDVKDMFSLNNYLSLLDQRKDKLLEELARAKLVTQEKREIMRQALIKVDALEKLKDNRRNEWALEQKRKEAVELDDINNSRLN